MDVHQLERGLLSMKEKLASLGSVLSSVLATIC
jgi:hypothetical protein